MISDRRCAAMLPVKDLERAKKWYADTLGFKPVMEDPMGVMYRGGEGSEFWLYPSEFAGTNQATAMAFMARELGSDMDDLRSKGVKFEEYDLPGIKTENGIAEFPNGDRGGWFKDPDGNILGIFESPKYS